MPPIKRNFLSTIFTFITRVGKITIPGTGGISIAEMYFFFLKESGNIRLSERAAAISFNFLLGIPPLLIFLFSLLVYVPVESAQDMVLDLMRLLTPDPVLTESAESILRDFMNNKQKEIMSFSFVSILFVSSNGMMGLLRSFDRVSPVQVRRSGLARRWKAILLTIELIVVFLIAIAIVIIQTSLLDTYITDLKGNPQYIKAISWISLVLIIYISFCILYKYGPSLQIRFRFFSIGALIATLLSLIVSYCFFAVATHFINYNKLYGSLGTLLMFMIWTFITGMVLLIGYEVNLLSALHRKQKTEPKAEY